MVLFKEDPKLKKLINQNHLSITKPEEPANTNWRNLHVPQVEIKVRGIFITLIFGVLLWGSYKFQNNFSKLQFENEIFESIDCGIYRFTE
jgi:hypothetical protein